MIASCRVPIVAFASAAVMLMAAARAEGAASLIEARELYAAAAYADALTMLDGLLRGAHTHEERQALELYRVLCLVAVGQREDADLAVEGMIRRDPLYRPTSDDIPPRICAAFTEARKRLLPSMVQEDYTAAKGAFDRKDFGTASKGFGRVLTVLAEPDIAVDASQPPLSDLRALAEGFRDLSAKMMAPPSPAPEMPVPGRIYTAADRQVMPPAVIKQRLPRFRRKAAEPAAGAIEVVIDTTGAVQSARMTVPLDRHYDSDVVAAAKGWQYRPATLNGIAVKFRKEVRVTLIVTSP
jgi:hypothetical protein